MKIEHAECIPMRYQMEEPIYSGTGKCTQKQLALIRIVTDSGLVGIGEAATYGGPAESTAEIVNHELVPLLIGEDPLQIERIWHKCYYAHYQHGRGGIFISALSGIDMALWDLMGKACGQPLYKLLGGFRRSIPVYASAGFYQRGKDTDALIREAVDFANQGYHGVKIKAGRTNTIYSLGEFNPEDGCRIYSLEEDIERVAAVKEALGRDCPLMVDVNAAWCYADAITAGKAYDKIGLHFIEEPLRPDYYEYSAKLAAELVTRIAGYETECLAVNYNRLIRAGAIDVAQPDLSWCGGISEARKIAVIADASSLECTPHVWSSGILLSASAHFVCAIPNGGTMEYDLSDNVFRTELVKQPLKPDENGIITLSDAPGLGVELNEDVISRYRV